eukprot:TRINITY_DN22838_c0_g1_i1.p2 TRINITY_DN22838_c0_g1~~TRINITY_DN22838_c0_g1_i1.p2  ORF type:complete len:249 (+),score=12.66 TRINITY_DN22838_c0_g1_i1:231-977(+)
MQVSAQLKALIAPIVCYWVVGSLYELFGQLNLFQQYRIHSKEEEIKRNPVKKWKVVLLVISQQVGQCILGILIMDPKDDVRPNEPFFDIVLQWITGMLVMDAWQYTIHRLFHEIPSLYRNVHSWHHRLYVPYAYGALFNHPVEGFMLDTIGGGLSYFIAGMSNSTAAWFFTFATFKTVMDHCGYVWPVNPINPLFQNNALYHDLHHQPHGIKKNYCQPFFTVWDRVFGSYENPSDGITNGKLENKKGQ